MLNNIYAQLRSEVYDYTNNFIEIVYGYNFNTYETIKRCHSYYNSQFQDKSKISGLDKIFYNISKLRAVVASKMLAFSPDDLVLTATNPSAKIGAFLLQQELKQWNRSHNMERTFNNFRRKAPIYGVSVIKKVKDNWDKGIVDLRRYAQDPTVESVQDSRFVIIKHYLTDSDLRRMAKSNGWDKDSVEEVIRKDRNKNAEAPKSYPMRETNVSNIIRSSVYHEVWERYGEVPEHWLNDTSPKENEENVRSLFIVANPFDLVKGNNGFDVDGGTILFKSEWKKEWPFKDYHYDKTEGRWLGVGVIEDLFPAQERMNEMANQKRVAMLLSSMHIFQTQDQTIVQNILTDLQSGDVIRAGAQGGLTPLANEERNLAAFQLEEQRYDKLSNAVSFVNDILLGEPGVSKTATGDAIMNSNVTSQFEDKREAMALVLKDYYKEMVLPEALKDLTPEHIMRFQGNIDEINYFDNEYAKLLADEKIVSGEVNVEGEDDYNALVQTIVGKLKKMGKERFIQIKKDMYKNLDFDFEFVTKKENNTAVALMQQSFQFLSAVAQNPMLLQNPMVKPLFYKINEMMGINPLELEYNEQQNESNNQNQYNPAMSAMNAMNTTTINQKTPLSQMMQ